jgi:15-cis-phytoene synthase
MKQIQTNQMEYLKESNLILANKGKTFYWAKFLLNKKHATNAVRLYRFCRYVDDIGDESTDPKLAKVILNKIIKHLKTGISDDVIVSDAIALFKASEINVKIPISLIQGIISDLSLVRMKDEASLAIYCYQVAGTVGLMMSKILEIKDSRAYAHAIDLGMAMQMTNICRDVIEDAQLNRRYLPATLIGEIEPQALINPNIEIQAKIKSSLVSMLDTADEYYQSGYNGLCFLPIRARLGIAIASGLYRHIGINLRRKHYASWAFRSVVSKKHKAWLTIKILAFGLLDKDFHLYQHQHRASLHHSIKEIAYSHV